MNNRPEGTQSPCVYCGRPGRPYPDKPRNPYWGVRPGASVCEALDCQADARNEVCCPTGCRFERRLTAQRYLL